MIKTPTVFVLGAGASMPYGYPSGDILRSDIIANLSDYNDFYREILHGGFSEDVISNFKDSFFYSSRASIDAFLEYRTEFIDIGKRVIARSLIPYENLNTLFEEGKGKWYDYFFNRLSLSFDDFDKNQFGVITYNYDRSFEQFLFTALKNTYNKTDEECVSKLEKIPIIHVHGKLNDLKWQNSAGREYDKDRNYGAYLLHSANGIKIIHEDIDDSESFKEAHKLLDHSEKIYFLGFGYNEKNLERLKISEYLDRTIQGTSLGLLRAETDYACKLFDQQITLSNCDALTFLRNNLDFE